LSDWYQFDDREGRVLKGLKRRWLMRAALLAICACAGLLALWDVEFPSDWFLFNRRAEPQAHSVRPQPPSNLAPGTVIPQPPLPNVSIAFPGIDSSVSEQPQKLVLTGTVIGRNAAESMAFLGVSERNPQTYRAGATLINGARLTQIAKNYVVLERGGKSVRLYAQGVKSRGQDRSGASELLIVGGPQSFKPAVATLSEEFTDYIRPSPVYRGEKLTGYEVYPGKESGVFARLGLEPGDVITAIGDATLNDPQQTMELFRQLADGAALVATVKRKGRQERIALDGTVITTQAERASEAQRAPVTPPMS
jgi:general secretion pathway protein C